MSDATLDSSSGSAPTPTLWLWLIGGFGALSIGFFFGWVAWFGSSLTAVSAAMGVGTIVAPAAGLVWGSYRLERSEISPARYGRVVGWCFAVGVGFLAVNLLAIVLYPWYGLAGNVAWAHFSINAGAAAGFAIGYVEAQAVQREVAATAAAVRAERLEDEREVLTYLNDLLRHEVLNGAQIINGNASLLLEDADGTRRDRLETIERQSTALTDVIDDVRAMLNANRGLESSIDLAPVLADELASFDRRVEAVEVEAEIPESVLVEGNEGVKWIFANLLENAVEHNDADEPRVEVSVETTAESAVVTVADNGPGIPLETRSTLFERKSDNHGLGLYLVRILATRYGGDVELAETGPNGSVFTVALPRAEPDDPDDAAAAPPATPDPTANEGENEDESEDGDENGNRDDESTESERSGVATNARRAVDSRSRGNDSTSGSP